MAAYPEIGRRCSGRSPTRAGAQLLDSLNRRNGQTLRELCAGLDMARQSVSKHLAMLEAANLVTTVRRGREKLHYLNAAPINAIAERWITRYDRGARRGARRPQTALEDAPWTSPSFVYTTYIRTTPEQLWQALTDPAFTRRYWGVTLRDGLAAGLDDDLGDGAASRSPTPSRSCSSPSPYRRLSFTWHTVHARAGRRRSSSPRRCASGSRPSGARR